MSRCFSLRSLLLVLVLIAMPFATTVSAKPASSAKKVVKNKARTSQAVAKSKSSAKKAVTTKSGRTVADKKAVAPKKSVIEENGFQEGRNQDFRKNKINRWQESYPDIQET